MNPAEFKEKFKVGDEIINPDPIFIGFKYRIVSIGDKKFIGKNIDDNEVLLDQDMEWTKVEPEKKPSKEIDEKLYGTAITFMGNVAEFDKRKNAEYANNRIDAICQWLDENWPKVVKKGE